MTIKEALLKHKKSIDTNETELLLSHLLSLTKAQLFTHSDKPVSPTILKKYEQLINKRKLGWPIAYLTGYKDFYGIRFKVNPSVLIPRPETEWLVDKSLELIKARSKQKTSTSVLEIGTGSGCIAISIAKNLKKKNVKIFATDISSKVLIVAKENAALSNAKVSFSKLNLFNGLRGKFDIIIANLPYVPARDYKKFQKDLKHEPKLALVDKNKDFDLLNKFINQAPLHLKPTGVILIEADPLFFKQNKARFSKVYKDIRNLDRFGEIQV